MNDVIEQESDVSREIEALRAILRSGTVGAPARDYLEAALAVLESANELPQAMSLTSEASSQKDKASKEPGRSKSLGSMDSLGGGNII
ncbi:hypothetical protein DKY63_28515 [Pseudomonas putida]|uniref:Uncharacterized protein n=1 Tax=Pseudomonas putida TaxID=303 RepID=A0A2Z4RRP3_PSEPU|nr:hypothetical protein [Pseudomonas putida]AWY43652.1 hypothetical protein DKY63_28515 [Pseudomonas putida]